MLISLGDHADVAAKAAEHGIETVLLIEDFTLPNALGVSGSPGLLVLDGDGRIVAKPIQGTRAVAEHLAGGAAPLSLVQVEGG